MAGHGSPPPENKADHPARKVGRPSDLGTPFGPGSVLVHNQADRESAADPRSQASKDTHARLEASFAARKAAGNYRAYMDDDAINEGRTLNREGYD
jgi:hypothetical protein